MPAAPMVRVHATFEISAKAAPHLQSLLRESITPQISCKFIEATIHAEQVQHDVPVEQAGDERSDGHVAEQRDADQDGQLAGAPGQGELEPGSGDSDDGSGGEAVLRDEGGAVVEPASEVDAPAVEAIEDTAAPAAPADSGLREGTGGDGSIVAKEE